MPSTYNLSHSSGPSASHPTIYLLVEEVASPQTLKFIRVERPDQDVKGRKRAKRDRKIQLIGTCAKPNVTGISGLDVGAGFAEKTGLEMYEALENALLTWKNSGSTTVQIGKTSAGAAKTHTGFIESINWSWKPSKDDIDGDEQRRFTITFVIGSVA